MVFRDFPPAARENITYLTIAIVHEMPQTWTLILSELQREQFLLTCK